MFYNRLASWCSGSAFISWAEGPRFKSGPVRSDTMLLTARQCCDTSSKGTVLVVLPAGAMARDGPRNLLHVSASFSEYNQRFDIFCNREKKDELKWSYFNVNLQKIEFRSRRCSSEIPISKLLLSLMVTNMTIKSFLKADKCCFHSFNHAYKSSALPMWWPHRYRALILGFVGIRYENKSSFWLS